MKKLQKSFYHHFFAIIPSEFQDSIESLLLDKIHTGLFWVSLFMPVFIVLRTIVMFEKVPSERLFFWSSLTLFFLFFALPLSLYYKKNKKRHSNLFWQRILRVLAFIVSSFFAMTPWLMYHYLHPYEVILFSAFLSIGVVIQIMIFSGFISLWLIATLPVLGSTAIYSYFNWSFDPHLGEYFSLWIILSMTYMFFMALHHNKTLIESLVLRLTLSDANNEKSRFLSVMSHEIRTPLSSIIGISHLLTDEALTKQQQKYVSHINSAGSNLLHILNNILFVSSTQNKTIQTHQETFNTKELIVPIIKTFRLQAHEKGLPLILEIDKKVPNFLYGDAARLRQILMNLLSNAIKFTTQGTIKIIVENIPKEGVSFSVIDTGIGIESASTALIFKEFSQINPPQKNNFDGVGLGLTIVAELVKRLNGRLSLISEVNKGSHFQVILPLTEASQSTRQATVKTATPIDLILIEDNDLNREITTSLLTRQGHHVHEATTAENALKLLKNTSPKLIITDLNLPQMSGIDLARKLQKIQPSLPIIALTANATAEVHQHCLAIGMKAVLTKPIEEKQLNQVILQHIENKQPQTIQTTDLADVAVIFTPKVALELSDVMSEKEIYALFTDALNTIENDIKYFKKQQTLSQAHHLTGSCANLGLLRLAQQLRVIEDHLRANTSCATLCLSLEALFRTTQQTVMAYFQKEEN